MQSMISIILIAIIHDWITDIHNYIMNIYNYAYGIIHIRS